MINRSIMHDTTLITYVYDCTPIMHDRAPILHRSSTDHARSCTDHARSTKVDSRCGISAGSVHDRCTIGARSVHDWRWIGARSALDRCTIGAGSVHDRRRIGARSVQHRRRIVCDQCRIVHGGPVISVVSYTVYTRSCTDPASILRSIDRSWIGQKRPIQLLSGLLRSDQKQLCEHKHYLKTISYQY